jgi:uncharacterized Zn-finger protein
MFSRCDNDNERPGPLDAEVILVQHSVAEANASDESDVIAKQEDEQIGIFQILDKLEETVDAFLNTSSSLVLPLLEATTMQKPYGCPLFTKSFSRKQELKRHMRVHTGDKPHTCKQCSKSFSQAVHLRIHMRVHTGEISYSCSQCSKTFAHSYGLHVHLRIHSEEKPHSCSQCSKSFTDSSGLRAHLRIHSGEKPYSCSQCSKSFARSSELQLHLRIHSGETQYIGPGNMEVKSFPSQES